MESLQHPPSSGEYNSPYLHPGGSLHREGPSASRLLGTWEIHSVSQLQTLWNSPWFGSLGGGWKAWCGVVVLVVWHTNLRNGELFRVGKVCIFYPLVRFNNKKRGWNGDSEKYVGSNWFVNMISGLDVFWPEVGKILGFLGFLRIRDSQTDPTESLFFWGRDKNVSQVFLESCHEPYGIILPGYIGINHDIRIPIKQPGFSGK